MTTVKLHRMNTKVKNDLTLLNESTEEYLQGVFAKGLFSFD